MIYRQEKQRIKRGGGKVGICGKKWRVSMEGFKILLNTKQYLEKMPRSYPPENYIFSVSKLPLHGFILIYQLQYKLFSIIYFPTFWIRNFGDHPILDFSFGGFVILR